jgi:hypothetical protein
VRSRYSAAVAVASAPTSAPKLHAEASRATSPVPKSPAPVFLADAQVQVQVPVQDIPERMPKELLRRVDLSQPFAHPCQHVQGRATHGAHRLAATP